MKTLTPRSSYYLIRYTAPKSETRGGILIPEEYRTRANEGEVVAVGPGREIPTLPGERTVMAAAVGDRVLYVGHDLQPLDEELGLVDDESLLGIVDEQSEDLLPANDWVTLTVVVRATETRGGILVPDRFQERLKRGCVRRLGPGELRTAGPWQGTRRTAPEILGLQARQASEKNLHATMGENELLVGRVVWWDAGARMVEVKLPSGERLYMVRASELAAIEEED